MTARRKARRRALDILFEADMRGTDPLAVLADVKQRRSLAGDSPLNPYTESLVEGVVANRAEIDLQLSTYAIGWTLDRMPTVDRNVLRIGAFEVMHETVPAGVAISEAVELVTELSTDESPKFVNGLLGRLARLKADVPRVGFEPTLDGV